MVNLPDPAINAGEALIRVTACGFSHHDALVMEGSLRRGVTLPRVLGHEIAGVVAAVGAGVNQKLVGRDVAVMPGELGHRRHGGFAELVSTPANAVVPLTSKRLDPSGALLASPIAVALKAIENSGLAAGDSIVITGVSGGIGAHAAQIAHAAGIKVLGVTSSEGKVAVLQEQPWASTTLLASDPWEDVVMAITGDKGADAGIDAVGSTLPRLIRSIRHGGKITLLGQVSSDAVPIMPAELIFRELTLSGSLSAAKEHIERALALLSRGEITALIDEEIPLTAEALMSAYKRVKARAVFGRIVVRP